MFERRSIYDPYKRPIKCRPHDAYGPMMRMTYRLDNLEGFTIVSRDTILTVAAMLLVVGVHYYCGFLFPSFLFGLVTLFKNREMPIPYLIFDEIMELLLMIFNFIEMIKNLIKMIKNLIKMILNLIQTSWEKISSHFVGYWSMPGPFRSRISAFIFLLIGPEHLSAQPSGSAEKGAAGNYRPTSSKPDKCPPRWWSIDQSLFKGTTAVDWTCVIMFAGIMLAVWCFYNNRGSLIAYCIYGITFLIREFDNLTGKIENLIEKVRKNKIEYLGAVYQLSNIALSSPFLGGTHKWKASMVAGISVFAVICYCGKVSVELKRANVTSTFFYHETRNNKKVLFFTARHVLEFLIPLSYSLLACVYLTELDTKNHRTEDDWRSVAFSILVFVHVIGGLLAFMNARNPYYFRQGDQNQMIPMHPIDTIPRQGNEIILKDKLVVAEELSEVVRGNQHADVSVAEMILVIGEEVSEEVVHVSVAQGYVENQSADTDVSTIYADNLVPDVTSEDC